MVNLNLSVVEHHPAIEDLAEVMSTRVQNDDRKFFRITAAYYLSVMAATMRATIFPKDRGEIPVANYVISLAPSGSGKGHSTAGIMEGEFLKDFRRHFLDITMPTIAEDNLWKLACYRAGMKGTEEQTEYDGLDREYQSCGAFVFVFDDGSAPAIKQLRQKLLLANTGSINMQVDEIGSNIMRSTEALGTFLELYDQGMIKSKIKVSNADNKRSTEIEGKTPTNMLLMAHVAGGDL